jgi:hypothetical protein
MRQHDSLHDSRPGLGCTGESDTSDNPPIQARAAGRMSEVAALLARHCEDWEDSPRALARRLAAFAAFRFPSNHSAVH